MAEIHDTRRLWPRPLGAAALLAACVGLAGCATDPAQLAAEDTARCRGYGMKPGTEAFANCRMTLDVERRRERSRRLDDLEPRYGRFGPYYGGW
ncbi:hypothetical protein ACFSCV_14750 [Methylopila henanensis]|uniref:Lipoprotein n=1 Tax=Methylopila henanensis TaxID=873516 RepID=A0ABW4KCK1_9HYPH